MKDAREKMVATQIARRGIKDPLVLAAMRAVPRERFVPEQAARAYEDRPLPIAAGQTISQPYIVALMIEAAGVKPGSRVLNVGSGSGYAAAVMAEIGAQVFAIERHAELADASKERLAALGYHRITVRRGDGSKGWPEEAPFDAIIVDAAGPALPEALKQELAIGGRLVAPIGDGYQELIVLTQKNERDFEMRSLGGVQFVPLIED
ncbi:MAG: protein-L-isoaspartate(D-aspartate) O-methyltransferase [Hyphomonadaceae bacterium]|nr:protein-L-isoaspartate(D-aspartate) O-methyltransferase [Hyphomonadaceae bacterium]